MNNIILNIVGKKQNLSHPFIFKKLGKYFWNKKTIKEFFNMDIIDIIENSVYNKQYKILKILIHTENNYALRYAVDNGHFEIVKYLIENGADIHSYNDAVLRRAAERNHLDIVKYLVENGAVMN